MQLDLAFWPRTAVRSVLLDYLAMQVEHVAEATVCDYQDRVAWLLRVLGEGTDARAVTYDTLDTVVRRYGPKGDGLMLVTLKKRFVFLRAAYRFAAERRIIQPSEIPGLPKLRDDGERRTRFLPVERWDEFALALPPGRIRRFALCALWTGQHSLDVFRAKLDDFKPAHAIGPRVGAFMRRNHKNERRGVEPILFPAEPEFVEIMQRWSVECEGGPSSLLTEGRVWGLTKTFAAACDRMGVDRVSPIDLRRSYATMLEARGYSLPYIRIALGHIASDSRIQGGESQRPTTVERHYLRTTPEMLLSKRK